MRSAVSSSAISASDNSPRIIGSMAVGHFVLREIFSRGKPAENGMRS